MPKNALATYFATKLDAEWGPYDLQHALDERREKIVILDTRTADAFADEHIQGAVSIPEADLDKRMKELPKTKEVVTYCWSITCHIATRVALKLANKGFKVHELSGGIEKWKAAEFPVESSKAEPALTGR